MDKSPNECQRGDGNGVAYRVGFVANGSHQRAVHLDRAQSEQTTKRGRAP